MTTLGWAPRIPDQWDVVPLNFVATMGTGHTPDRSKPEYWENCSIPWITLTDASRHGQSLAPMTETHQQISDIGMRNSAAVLHPAGTVVLSRTASVGHSAIMGRPMATSQDFATWTCGPRLDPRYLLLVLRAMKPEWERLAFGSTHKTIYMPDIEALRIPLPPIPEQRQIGELLAAEVSRIDQIVGVRRRQLATLNELAGARLATAMECQISRHGSVALRRIVVSIEQGWSPQCDDVVAGPEEWAVLKTSAVSSGLFRSWENKRLPQGVERDRRYAVSDGDILMTRGSGSPSHVGVAVEAITEGRRLLLSDLLYRIRLHHAWSSAFAALALRSRPVRHLMALLFRGQSGQTIKLRAEDVRSIEIPAVPVGEQVEFAAKIQAEQTSVLGVLRLIEASMTSLDERRQALITAAVTGQIDVTTARGVTV